MPLVSFIVPIFNCASYLKQCLDSILAQSINDYEVILVNDGSQDNSGDICDIYVKKDSRFRVVHKKNEGLSAARNDGLELAQGDWITFVDSDDWVEPHFLDVLVANKNVDYIVTSINHQQVGGRCITEKFIEQEYDTIDDSVFVVENLKQVFFTAWSKFFKKKIVNDNQLRFIPGVSPGEDTIFVFQYLNHIHSLYLSDKPCYNWRVANGLTNRKRNFDWIKYTIDQTIVSIEQVEEKFDIDLSFIKFNSLHYLIDKIDVGKYTYKQLLFEIKTIASKPWMVELIGDSKYVRKGKYRHIIDFLICRKSYMLVTILCKQVGRFY